MKIQQHIKEDDGYREIDSRCLYCNEPLPDGEEFCDSNCRKGYKNDN